MYTEFQEDYTIESIEPDEATTITFNPTETQKCLTITIIEDDIPEQEENFFITLSGSGANSVFQNVIIQNAVGEWLLALLLMYSAKCRQIVYYYYIWQFCHRIFSQLSQNKKINLRNYLHVYIVSLSVGIPNNSKFYPMENFHIYLATSCLIMQRHWLHSILSQMSTLLMSLHQLKCVSWL